MNKVAACNDVTCQNTSRLTVHQTVYYGDGAFSFKNQVYTVEVDLDFTDFKS
jgi:hypothetical protein